jgi:GT2 family glycosyltransferase
MTTPVPHLSVVVPNYRRSDLLRRCLTSVQEAVEHARADVEVVVVDDGSRDDSADMVAREFPAVELVALPENRGYPGAVNAGIAAARADWVLTLNNDTTVDPDLFDALLDVARSDPSVGVVAAQQRFASDPGVIYSAGITLTRHGHITDRLMGRPVGDSETVPVEVFGATGSAALYRRSVLEELGGFDEEFRFGLEDADVAWRARMRGWRCLYAPRAIVLHELGGTVPHGTDLRYFQAGRNRLMLIAKNLDTRQLLRAAPRIVAFDLMYVGYALVRLRTTVPLRGRIAGLAKWRAMRRAGADARRPVPMESERTYRDALRRRATWARAGQPRLEAKYAGLCRPCTSIRPRLTSRPSPLGCSS